VKYMPRDMVKYGRDAVPVRVVQARTAESTGYGASMFAVVFSPSSLRWLVNFALSRVK